MEKHLFGKVKKIKKVSSTVPRNIDLKISPIPLNLSIGKRKIIKKTSKMAPKNKSLNPAYTINKIRKMNWKQLKQRFPGLSPTADADFDGLINSRDCKPLDPSKDGIFSRVLGVVTKGKVGQTKEEYQAERTERKAEKGTERLAKQIVLREKAKVIAERKAEKISKTKGYISERQRERLVKRQEKIERLRSLAKSRIAETIEKKIKRISPKDIASIRARQRRIIVKQVEKFAGVRGVQREGKVAKGVKGAGAGRPKQSYKYKDPRTGQPITAVEYHALRKRLRRQAKTVETQTEVKQRFALAKRGLSPEEVAEAQEEINERMARLRAMKVAKQEGVLTEELPSAEEQVIQQQVEQIPAQVVAQAMPTQAQGQQVPQRIHRVEPMTAVPGSYGTPPGYKVREDLMTGRKTLVPLPPREAWTR